MRLSGRTPAFPFAGPRMASLPIVTVCSRDALTRIELLAESAAHASDGGPATAVVVDDPTLTITATASGVTLASAAIVERRVTHQLQLLSSNGRALATALTAWVALH